MPEDFSKGVIYKIICKDPNVTDIYVGSSCDFEKRIKRHKESCNNPKYHGYNYKVYKCIRDNGNFDNWLIEIIEPFPCANKLELKKREIYWILHLGSNLNSQLPCIFESKEEYDKNRYEQNKEQIKQERKQYYEHNKEEITKRRKKFNQENREKIAEKNKEYYDKHKEQISEKGKEKITCICGKTFRKKEKARHERTQYHINFINNKL